MIIKQIITLVLMGLLLGCQASEMIDTKDAMRSFVKEISDHARSKQPDFIVIPQNAQELWIEEGVFLTRYQGVFDGLGREDLFYGYDGDHLATPHEATTLMVNELKILQESGHQILVTDYTNKQGQANSAHIKNERLGFTSFVAPDRELNQLPQTIHNVNSREITKLKDVSNFLYLLNPELFETKSDYLQALSEVDYDVLILDAMFHGQWLTKSDLADLKVKTNGNKRLVIAYMSIGEAEDYRFYWKWYWSYIKPSWLDKENPLWKGNYKVKFWYPSWKQVIYGQPESYLDSIVRSGFDGVYLDIIDAYLAF